MADKKISQLTAATTPLAGTEVLPIVQTGATVKASIANVQAAPVAAGTANGIQYLDGSKVPSTSSNLTWNGNIVGVKTTPSSFGTFYPGLEGQGPAAYVVAAKGNALQLSSGIYNNNSFQDLYSVTAQKAAKYLIDAPNGNHVFYVTNTAGTTVGDVATLASAFEISSTANVTVTSGNLVIGTAGKGIDFSADPSAAGMTSELLDDYEEGTWTAALTLASGSVTYGSQLGKYVKVGNVVTVNAWVYLTGVSSPTGDLTITLPIAMGATGIRPASAILVNGLTGVTGQVYGWLAESDSILYLRIVNNGSVSVLQGTNLTASTELYVSITYTTF
jgi:hypothetical protein